MFISCLHTAQYIIGVSCMETITPTKTSYLVKRGIIPSREMRKHYELLQYQTSQVPNICNIIIKHILGSWQEGIIVEHLGTGIIVIVVVFRRKLKVHILHSVMENSKNTQNRDNSIFPHTHTTSLTKLHHPALIMINIWPVFSWST